METATDLQMRRLFYETKTRCKGGNHTPSQKIFALSQEIVVWEEKYREKHTAGKSDEQLIKDGWWKDNFGMWYCMKLGEARERTFRNKLDKILFGIKTDAISKTRAEMGAERDELIRKIARGYNEDYIPKIKREIQNEARATAFEEVLAELDKLPVLTICGSGYYYPTKVKGLLKDGIFETFDLEDKTNESSDWNVNWLVVEYWQVWQLIKILKQKFKR